MDVSDIERVLNKTGMNYVAVRKECLIQCANLLDTHEVTLAEKNCAQNCFKKLTYAKEHFNNLTVNELSRLNGLKDSHYHKAV